VRDVNPGSSNHSSLNVCAVLNKPEAYTITETTAA